MPQGVDLTGRAAADLLASLFSGARYRREPDRPVPPGDP